MPPRSRKRRPRPEASTTSRELLPLLASIACIPYVLWSVCNSIAGYQDFLGRSYIEAWQHQALQAELSGTAYSPTAADKENAQFHSRLATRLTPYNPDFLVTQGNTLLWDAAHATPVQPIASDKAETMLSSYHRAIDLRPTWPDNYLQLARAYVSLGLLGAEFQKALSSTMHYGPWKPDLMYGVIELGMAQWERLPPDSRKVVVETIDRSQRWNLDEKSNIRFSVSIWNLVVANNRKAEVCALLPPDNARTQRFCQPLPLQQGKA